MAHFPLRRSCVRSRGPMEWTSAESASNYGVFFSLVTFTNLTQVHQAFKHVFTSLSSVEHEEPRATRAGNAYIHGMSRVTEASLAYIATQVIFYATLCKLCSR